ncbi:DUF1214 domain-containing protein [Microvirga tunisiensis]|uniref:DUF1214 domain-containing protein n=2 Tax=Pannonibacter tanglangensis TaxID=2750084 RepID=A0ABW9ZEK8_9HYPH|nr:MULTISPECIES: DUF1214 domain-containing protein [unclassified Pannonibacter]NBN62911.1 DUF1214 domain-containing protein [Pannonibacter sp. XCT-34]NBN78485.1 DUF1214 domain-containing protein [Pannonibacter sp. XCT-53]
MKSAFPLGPETDWQKTETPEILQPSRMSPAARALALLATVVLAVALGLGSAWLALDREDLFQQIRIGVWGAHPQAGTPEADPYSAAIYARSGRVPLANGEGVAFTATTDSAGAPLSPGCTYRVSGQTPTARLWTLTAMDRHGRLLASAGDRVSLSSVGLLRAPDGSFGITASRRPHPGNWLPLGDGDGLTFVLRLYDAPITTGASLTGLAMPAITRISCP